MNKTTEDYLNELPYRITRTIERKCPHCGKNFHKLSIQYELTFEMFPFEHSPNMVKLRYELFYKAKGLYFPERDMIIGENAGLGHKTIKEAVEALKEYLEKRKTNERTQTELPL